MKTVTKNISKSVIAFTLFASSTILSTPFTIPEENIFASKRVAEKAIISFEDGDFFASVNGRSKLIKSYDVSGLPNNLTEEQLRKFLKHGFLSVKKIGNDYGIEGKIRGIGGTKETTPSQSSIVGSISAGIELTNSILEITGHRSLNNWFSQSNHRSPREWLSQGNHRTPWEWICGVPSRNK